MTESWCLMLAAPDTSVNIQLTDHGRRFRHAQGVKVDAGWEYLGTLTAVDRY